MPDTSLNKIFYLFSNCLAAHWMLGNCHSQVIVQSTKL